MSRTRACIRVLYVVGARPNFMKVAPVIAAAERCARDPAAAVRFENILVHTGQHYDPLLSDVFFRQLGLPDADEHLGVGSGSHAVQTARLLEGLEPVFSKREPDLIVVPGDVNSTCAAALVAAKLCIPVVHLEAGLRSGDRSMPEEVNRIVVDHLSDLLLATCQDGVDNLVREGIPQERVVKVGNTMIDSLVSLRSAAVDALGATRARLGLGQAPFVLVTLHRPSNVDEPRQLRRLLELLGGLSDQVSVVFPMHLRTRERLLNDSRALAQSHAGLHIVEPLGYLEFLGLMMSATVVVTDSGGVQEETTYLGVPCVTVRTTTERPITLTLGTNRLADPEDAGSILSAIEDCMNDGRLVSPPELPFWDGHASERVIAALARDYAEIGDLEPDETVAPQETGR